MFLLVAATEKEMQPVRLSLSGCPFVECFVSGVGLLETAASLARHLAERGESVRGVINFGVAGAFLDSGVEVLDICLAEKEVLGDFGVCSDHLVEGFAGNDIVRKMEFALNGPMLLEAEKIFHNAGLSCHKGTFVTVQCASGTARRGVMLRDQYAAIAENMEGAAVARVCEMFNLPCLELRSISNMVEDRNLQNWRLSQACRRGAEAVALLARTMIL